MPLTNQTLAEMAAGLAALSTPVDDVELVECISLLEMVKNAAAAAQARAAVALRVLREEQQRDAGRSTARTGTSVAAEIGLARRESPHRGRILLGVATILEREMPHTLRLFAAGEVSEYRAMLLVRETACLSRADRARVDATLAGELPGMSDREVVARARQVAYELDPHSVVERSARAAADRRVTIRPAPDTMAIVSALLPMAQGVAVWAALTREADRLRASGDPRGRGQVMADTLVCRATGQATADGVPVEIQLVMSDEALLGNGSTPARLVGHGPVPAGVARELARRASEAGQARVRRLYVRPGGGQLVAMESRKRRFPKGLAGLIASRDEICRTPWCGAPVRHIDHVIPAHAGGATSAVNGQGLCVQCNLVKEHPGWLARPGPDGEVITTSPSGHEHTSWSSPMVGSGLESTSTPTFLGKECVVWPSRVRLAGRERAPVVDLVFREFQIESAA